MRTDSFFQDSVVVTQCSQCYFSVLESGFRYRESIGKDSYHTRDIATKVTYGLYGFQATTSGRYQILDDHYFRTRFQFSFDKVFQSMIFWRRADVYEWQS